MFIFMIVYWISFICRMGIKMKFAIRLGYLFLLDGLKKEANTKQLLKATIYYIWARDIFEERGKLFERFDLYG